MNDVSPRAFLKAQVSRVYREKWDKTMAGMETLRQAPQPIETGNEKSQDVIYYRTRWPWPLKDRDYTLARRTKIFPEDNAIVFVSKSMNHPHPLVDGTMRVDKYWCHSTFFSTWNELKSKMVVGKERRHLIGSSCLDCPGTRYEI